MEDGFRAWTNQDKIENIHQDESTWLISNCSRLEAEKRLSNLPTGTFLIRPRRMGHYALSITCNNATNHCIIYETDRGYGFAEPYNIYESLKALVLHYSTNSLEEHNDLLTTTLKYPIFCPYIKQLQQGKSNSQSVSNTKQSPNLSNTQTASSIKKPTQ